jgi:SAM-dependent methyltransferase
MIVDNNLLYTKCPLCGAFEIGKLGDIDYFQPLNFSSTAISLNKTPELWKCNECKSGFTQYAIPEQEAVRLYESGAGAQRWVSKPFEKEKTRNVTQAFAKLVSSGCRVLDVGCNTGEFLDFARAQGGITAGVEYSVASMKIVEGKGHCCYSSLDKAQGPYDLITAFDVVEHLYDVSSFFHECVSLLSENGVMTILTGNISSFSAQKNKAGWWYARFPEHITFPSKKYYLTLPNYTVVEDIECYASTKFSSLKNQIFDLIKGILHGNFNALQFLLPDHMLVVLKKRTQNTDRISP